MVICNLCPNKCGADRAETLGACLAGEDMIINRIAPHYYEEPPISGNRGSGTVFFGGCTMKCVYCQNYAISRKPAGKIYSPQELAEELKKLVDKGVHNINFVTPTHFSDKIKRTLDVYRPPVPIVYNTSGYELPSVIKSLKGYVDVFLPDYKYADASLAKKLSGRKNYPEYAKAAISEMRAIVQDKYDENGIMLSGMIIRHLVLPTYIENSFAVVRSVKELFPNTTLSIMSQFTPISGGIPNRKLKPIEYKAVLREAEKLGLTNVFIQEDGADSQEFIPTWNF